jgi:hypothetical protein
MEHLALWFLLVKPMARISLCFALLLNLSLAQTYLVNLEDMASHACDFEGNAKRKVKVAIIDNGFENINFSSIDKSRYELVEFYSSQFIKSSGINPSFPGNPFQSDRHGTTVSQIVWDLTHEIYADAQVELLLLNGNGITNFRRAIAYAIEQEVQVIVYAQNWELGGNFDGGGFINSYVSQATDKGIFWINSIGNYGGQVHRNSVYAMTRSRLQFENLLDENQLDFILVWNDFSVDLNAQSVKDLDFEVYNNKGELVAKANRLQSGPMEGEKGNYTLYPRERVQISLPRGKFSVKVIDKSGNFSASDYARLIIKGNDGSFKFTSANSQGEILTPADNEDVFSIGDNSSQASRGFTEDGRYLPEIEMPINRAIFSNGIETRGTTNSAAVFAAQLIARLSSGLEVTPQKLREVVRQGNKNPFGKDSKLCESAKKLEFWQRRIISFTKQLFVSDKYLRLEYVNNQGQIKVGVNPAEHPQLQELVRKASGQKNPNYSGYRYFVNIDAGYVMAKPYLVVLSRSDSTAIPYTAVELLP